MVDATYDVLIVGTGPAGLAAALAASESDIRVAVIDENPAAGGQIHRSFFGKVNQDVKVQLDKLRSRHVTVVQETTVIDAPSPGRIIGLGPTGIVEFEYKNLILAVGARELFLPFPGWTLPNVMGVGGIQALLKGGLDVREKRVVVAGSGPLLIAVSVYLKHYGAEVAIIAEQTTAAKLAQFSLSIARYPSKLRQGAMLMSEVGRRLQLGAWVEYAEGTSHLEAVKLNKSSGKIQCDYLACAFGFVPNLELPVLLGCEIEHGSVKVDDLQKTNVSNVLCAGEPTGIGGIELSAIEGKIAGYAATGEYNQARSYFSERSRWQNFAHELDRAFELRNEVMNLANSETIVCRCEDVTKAELEGWSCGREAKLHTRCGMGPCQGRICGPTTRVLYGWEYGSVRPPLVPTPLSGLKYEKPIERDMN